MQNTSVKVVHAFLLAVCVTAMGGCVALPTFEETRELSHAHEVGSSLVVETGNGSISVEKSDRADVKVIARLRASSEERLGDAKVKFDTSDPNLLSIGVEWPGGKRHMREGCHFEVLVPDASDVKLRSSNGALRIVNLSGTADLKTSNGQIELTGHDGPVVARTSNGKILVADVSGVVDVSTSNGRVEVDGAADSVKAHSSNGSVHVALTSDSPGPVEAHTSNSSVDLVVGPAFTGALTLKTSNGSLNCDPSVSEFVVSRAKKNADLKFPGSNQRSSVRTSNGSVSVKRVMSPTISTTRESAPATQSAEASPASDTKPQTSEPVFLD